MNDFVRACARPSAANEIAFSRGRIFREAYVRIRRACIAALALLVLLAPNVLLAQIQIPIPAQGNLPGMSSRKAPSAGYFATFIALYDGDYKNALDGFQAALKLGIKTLQSRWLDSICYYTMVGEAQYHLGDYPAAMDNYNAALRLYVQHADFMLRVQFPPMIQTAGVSRGAAWGKSARGAQLGKFPDTIGIVVGTTQADLARTGIQNGQLLQQPEIFPISVQEIIRCTCLSMMRRQQLLGPLVIYDPFTDELISVTARRQGPPNHWSEAWLDELQGFAYAAGGKTGQAMAFLNRSLLVQGQFDHPLSSLAQLELGNLALRAGDLKTAASHFEEATYSAVDFPDGDVLEEAFGGWYQTQLLEGSSEPFEKVLTAAATWANHGRLHELQASVALSLAESLALRGQTQAATAVLDEIKPILARKAMGQCGIGSRFFYLTALAQYQRGMVPTGDAALTAALVWQKNGSKWLYQISTADYLCKTNPGGRFQPRTALTLYEQLLHDPAAADWSMRPLESLAVMSTPQPTAYEHWFEFAAQLSDSHAAAGALDVADLARRQRFLTTLPLGGRLTALRWLLESPEESLSNAARVRRQELLTRFPKYAETSQKVQQLRADLAQAATAEKPENQRELAAKFGELSSLSAAQEAVLHEMAVSREPAEILFPPIRKVKDLQQGLAPGHVLLAFYATNHGTYAWMFSKEKDQHWKINNPALLDRRIGALLRAVGNADASRELTESQLADVGWQQAARDVLDALLQGSKITFSEDSVEVTIVPDGMLWYLPFELLPLGGDTKEFRPLLMRSQVRYAPTVGLTAPDRQGRKSGAEYGIVAGKLYPTDTADVGAAAVEELRRVAPHCMVLHSPLPAASPLMGTIVDGLIVLDDIGETQGPYDWSPIPLDKPRTAGALATWLNLPWKSVDQFILPGFHTAAENSLKSPGSTPGSDLFLGTTALLATGARTVLISRWRTGGETAIDLIREFLQELPFVSAAEAWQRAVQVTSQTPLDREREPRLGGKRGVVAEGEAPKAGHPFFWAGYMLVDTGASAQQVDKMPEKPILKFEGKKADNKQP